MLSGLFCIYANPQNKKPNMNRHKNDMLKKLLAAIVLLVAVCPLWAQERTDTIYTFRFVPEEDMFYVPWQNNDKELARLETCINTYKSRITGGEIPLHVDGYCDSKESEAENLAVAKTRSNRVKSELITRQKLAEECFVTHNHSGSGDYVTVRLVVPVYNKVKETPADVQADTTLVETVESAETVTEPATADSIQDVQMVSEVVEKPTETKPYTFALRANLLRWATLTPDLGLEWRISNSWSFMVNGSWTSWSWNSKGRRYALWEVSPEVRYYIGKEKCGYVGAMFKAGEFNYKLSTVGKQGDLMGGGITGGYVLKLNKTLVLDFNIGLGYLNADYDRYEVIDGVRVRRGTENKNWWGPVSAGVTLVWNIF